MDQISNHFTWNEALYLPTWKRLANEQDGLNAEIKENLVKLFSLLDQIRDHFNSPINIHCAYRPEAYNAQIGGAANSAHKYGMAADFDVSGWDCEKARQDLLSSGLLEQLNLRMENNGPSAQWVHLDYREVPPGGHRYFIP